MTRERGPRRAAVVFIFITVLLDIFALGIVAPVLPKLVEGFLGGNTAEGARLFGLLATLFALMQFFAAPVLGALSDRYGRRPVVVGSNLGLGLDYLVMALAPSLAWIFVGRAVAGVMAASIPTAYAYIADVTPPERRAQSFGLLGAAFGIGFVLGPAVGGLLGQVDPRAPFWAAGILSLANAAYGFLVLPESLPRERRTAIKWRKANPIGALAFLRARPELFGLAGSNFLGYLAHVALPAMFALYTGYRFNWDSDAVGYALAAVGVSSLVVQGGLVGPVVKALGEQRALYFGLAAGSLGFLVYGMAPAGAYFYLGIPLVALWGIAGAAAQSLMSKQVDPTAQGELQGALASLRSVADLFGPTLFTLSFAAAISPGAIIALPGIPYLIASALVAAALLIAGSVLSRRVLPDTPPSS